MLFATQLILGINVGLTIEPLAQPTVTPTNAQREAHRLYNDAPPSVGTSYALKLFYTKLRLFILIAV